MKKAVGGSYQVSPEHVKMVVNTPEIRDKSNDFYPCHNKRN